MKYLLALLPVLLLVDARPADCEARPHHGSRPSGGWREQNGSAGASVAPIVQPSIGAEQPATPDIPVVVPTTTTAAAEATDPVIPPSEEPVLAGDSNAVATPNPNTSTSSSIAAPEPTTSAAPAPPPPAPAPASGVSPVGMAMNWESKANIGSFGGNIGWYYSWNLDPLSNTDGLEFVPMVHKAVMVDSFTGKVPAGTKSILGFNEPDIGEAHGGANMGVVEAANLHKKWTAKVPSGIRIGSPAVARGGKKWMQDWLAACGGGCKFDFVPFHFYGGPGSANELIAYAKDFHATFGKPLWLTEVACHDYSAGVVCNADQVKEMMDTAIGWFRSDEGKIVERWSWFGAFPNHAASNANGLLNPDGAANAIGKYYAGL